MPSDRGTQLWQETGAGPGWSGQRSCTYFVDLLMSRILGFLMGVSFIAIGPVRVLGSARIVDFPISGINGFLMGVILILPPAATGRRTVPRASLPAGGCESIPKSLHRTLWDVGVVDDMNAAAGVT